MTTNLLLQESHFRVSSTGSLVLNIDDQRVLDLGYAKISNIRSTDLIYVLEALQASETFRWDKAKRRVLWGNEPLTEADIEVLHLRLSKEHGINFPPKQTRLAIEAMALENSFDSFEEKLLEIERLVEPIPINNLSTRYFKTKKPIYDKYLELWLTNWVKRQLEPGCYNRTMLVVQGPQNIGKDQFVKILAGEANSTSVGCTANFKEKDLLTTFNSKSVLLFEELEQTTGRVVEGALKSFLSETSDSYVMKYKSHAEDHPRRCSYWGSCNKQEFLTDITGNTRFHVIPVGVDSKKGEAINLERLKEEREAIISGALRLYRKHKEGCYALELTQDERNQSEALNANYLEISQYEEPLAELLVDRTAVCMDEIRECIDLTFGYIDKRMEKEIKKAMDALGFKALSSRKIPCSGRKKDVRPWVRKDGTKPDYFEIGNFYQAKQRGESDF